MLALVLQNIVVGRLDHDWDRPFEFLVIQETSAVRHRLIFRNPEIVQKSDDQLQLTGLGADAERQKAGHGWAQHATVIPYDAECFQQLLKWLLLILGIQVGMAERGKVDLQPVTVKAIRRGISHNSSHAFGNLVTSFERSSSGSLQEMIIILENIHHNIIQSVNTR